MTAVISIASAQRIVDPDGASVDVFPLPVDEDSLKSLLEELFCDWWRVIVFGPMVEGAAWEWRAPGPPDAIHLYDGYLTVVFGRSHFHLCIGPHAGTPAFPVSAELARHRRTARAELFRRIDGPTGSPLTWGLRLFNGAGEQQITIFFPNPFLSANLAKRLRRPNWSKLTLWDHLRARWLGLSDPDPFDRSGAAFHHR
jgi:hypothetical protein